MPSFVFYILCIYLATAKRSIDEGWNILITYEYVYGCLISDERMSTYKTAFKHIVWSCLAFVLSYMKKEDELNTVRNLLNAVFQRGDKIDKKRNRLFEFFLRM